MSLEALAGGRYRVEELLGQGGMASVYGAHDTELDRPVAVKLLADNLAADSEFRARFLREARVAASLHHPNIVQVFDVGEYEGRPFIVMERVSGTTLADLLARRGAVPVAQALDVALQSCAGLGHAHEHEVVHRDVKPGNLLLRDDGVIKVADFGIARAAELTQLTGVGTVLGTAAYLSPEQAAGEPVTAAADVYSLGAVLYELLSGRPPFEFNSLADLAQKQRDGVVRPVRELAPAVAQPLEDVIMRSLARNPAYRPQSADALARELRAASPQPTTTTLPTRAHAATRSVPLPAPHRLALAGRERVWIVTAALLVLAALAGALALSGVFGTAARGAPTVAPIPRGSTPAQEAHNLSLWLRQRSR